jgi:hypothetical protein
MQKTIASIWLAIMAILLFSCSASKRLDKIHTKAPQTTAEKCHEWYSPETITKTVIDLRKGKPDTIVKDGPVQYAWVDCDSAIKTVEHTVRVPYALYKTEFISVTDTLKIHDSVVTVDRYEENKMRLKAEGAEKKLTGELKTIKILAWWAGIATLLIALYLIIKICK